MIEVLLYYVVLHVNLISRMRMLKKMNSRSTQKVLIVALWGSLSATILQVESSPWAGASRIRAEGLEFRV